MKLRLTGEVPCLLYKNVLVGWREAALIPSITATVMRTEMNGDFLLLLILNTFLVKSK